MINPLKEDETPSSQRSSDKRQERGYHEGRPRPGVPTAAPEAPAPSTSNRYRTWSPPTSLNTPGGVLDLVLHFCPMSSASSALFLSHGLVGRAVVGFPVGARVGSAVGSGVGARV